MIRFAYALIAATIAATGATSWAQQWPDKPVRILVPFPPGGGTDIQARLLATVFQKSMGQNFIIDNRTGAGGLIAGQLAVDSPPDGNTILFTSGSISVVVTLYAKRMKFDPLVDLQPISWLSSTPLVLSIHPSVPAKNVRQLVALAKTKPGALNGGGNTAGSTSHLTAEMLNQVAGIKSQVITYRGGGPAVIALISGEIDYLSWEPGNIEVRIYGDAAVIRYQADLKIRVKAIPDAPSGRFWHTDVYERRNGSWQVVWSQATQIV